MKVTRLVLVLAAAALVALAVARLAEHDTNPTHRGGTIPAAPLSPPIVGHGSPKPRLPSPAQLARARQTARGFLRGYLPFLYSRAPVRRIRHITARVRTILRRGRSRPSPAQRHRRPQLLHLTVIGQAPGAAIAAAQIDDGSVAPYPLTFTLRRRGAGWLVNGLGRD